MRIFKIGRYSLHSKTKFSLFKKKRKKSLFYLLSCLLHAGLIPRVFYFLIKIFIFPFLYIEKLMKVPPPTPIEN